MIKDSDLAGFNSDRLISVVSREMLRAGVDFDMKNRVSVDVQTVFIKWKANFKRSKFYCGKT
jgi:DNA polymerase-3 subunit epsilon